MSRYEDEACYPPPLLLTLCSYSLLLSFTGSPVSLVELILLRDPGSSNLDAMEDLRRLANEQPASAWTRLELDENNSRKVLPKHKGSSADDIAIADAKGAKFSWSWTLWRAQVPVPAEAKGGEDKWALVVRGSETLGFASLPSMQHDQY